MALLLVLLTVSCRRDVEPSLSDDPGPESWPANPEVLAFLNGKTLPVLKSGGEPLVIGLDGIEALSVQRHGVHTPEGGWATGISLVYNSRWARYTVEAIVEHRLLGEERVFSAFTVKRIAPR
jgi:hypothetical protein